MPTCPIVRHFYGFVSSKTGNYMNVYLQDNCTGLFQMSYLVNNHDIQKWELFSQHSDKAPPNLQGKAFS